MEIFDREIEIKFLYGPTAEASQFARSLRGDGIQLYLSLDQGHLYLLQESPAHSIHEAKGFSLHFHLGNCIAKDPANPSFGAKHPAFGLPGGEVGYREIAAFMFFLKTNHYFEQLKPILSFEVRPIMGENPAQLIRQSKEEFLKAWDLFQDSM